MDQNQVTREWNSMADDWDDLARVHAQSFYQMLRMHRLLPAPDADNTEKLVVLDFGCGTGLLTEKLQRTAMTVIAIDASPRMIDLLQEKVLSREWDNVIVMKTVIAQPSGAVDSLLEEYSGRVDLIVASSVLNFIPESDLQSSLSVLAQLLKPGTGRFCHSDWPHDEFEHPQGMTDAKMNSLYQKVGMSMASSHLVEFRTTPEESKLVYFGVAQRDS